MFNLKKFQWRRQLILFSTISLFVTVGFITGFKLYEFYQMKKINPSMWYLMEDCKPVKNILLKHNEITWQYKYYSPLPESTKYLQILNNLYTGGELNDVINASKINSTCGAKSAILLNHIYKILNLKTEIKASNDKLIMYSKLNNHWAQYFTCTERYEFIIDGRQRINNCNNFISTETASNHVDEIELANSNVILEYENLLDWSGLRNTCDAMDDSIGKHRSSCYLGLYHITNKLIEIGNKSNSQYIKEDQISALESQYREMNNKISNEALIIKLILKTIYANSDKIDQLINFCAIIPEGEEQNNCYSDLLIKADELFKSQRFSDAYKLFDYVAVHGDLNLDSTAIVDSEYYMAEMNLHGQGVQKDNNKAIKYYKSAISHAEKYKTGHDIGTMYCNLSFSFWELGEYVIAVNHAKTSAKMGNKSCQFNLGLYYTQGKGVPTDYKEAYAWIGISKIQGHDDKKLKDYITYQLILSGDDKALNEAKVLEKEYYQNYVLGAN